MLGIVRLRFVNVIFVFELSLVLFYVVGLVCWIKCFMFVFGLIKRIVLIDVSV